MLKIRTVFYTVGLFLLPVFFFSFHSETGDDKSMFNSADFELLHEFTDSVSVGRPGQNKIVLRTYVGEEYMYDEILFYKKEKHTWVLQNREIITETSLGGGRDEEFIDFNNDGYNDFTYIAAYGLRSANEMRHLFIYDPKAETLRFIRNSLNYPNLAYNEKLDCLDSHAIYGGSTTWFLRLQSDSLFRIADVTLFDNERTITLYNSIGNGTIIFNDTLGNPDCVHNRFSDYEISQVLEE